MSWFKRLFNREPEMEIVSSEIPMSTILRWYLYDTGLADPNELAEYLGLNNVSDEGNDKEIEDSKVRLARISPILPYIDTLSTISAETFASLHSLNADDDDKDEEFEMRQKIIFKAIAMSTLIGAMSIGVDIGMIEHGVVSADTLEMDIDYE